MPSAFQSCSLRWAPDEIRVRSCHPVYRIAGGRRPAGGIAIGETREINEAVSRNCGAVDEQSVPKDDADSGRRFRGGFDRVRIERATGTGSKYGEPPKRKVGRKFRRRLTNGVVFDR